jgi:translocator protein
MSPLWRILNLVSLLATLVINTLATTGALNGVTTGDLSNSFDNKIVPANLTFAIWALIYPLLLAFGVYQLMPAARGNARINAIGAWFVFSNIANCVWILAWHNRSWLLSMIAMLVLLATLLTCYVAMRQPAGPATRAERALIYLPISVYTGWITVATVVNAAIIGITSGWSGFGLSPVTWAEIMVVVAALIALAFGLLHRDAAYLFVLVWALFGIGMRQAGQGAISTLAYGAMAVLAIAALAVLIFGRTPPHSTAAKPNSA